MKQRLVALAWSLSGFVGLLAITAWYQSLRAPLNQLTIYGIFPLFGILAFSIMWSHYIVMALQARSATNKAVLQPYYHLTSLVVLAAILLHPGLLTWQLWRDGIGLPVNYVAPDLRLYVIFAEIAWLMFIAFELHRFFKKRSWWHYVERASEVAMILILIHGYKLGNGVLPEWFMGLWFFYGLTLLASIGYLAYRRHQKTGAVL